MVLEYYNLREQPFGVTPDPQYLYAGDTHVEALASLLYGLETGRGFVALIAKPGMGKTTLLFHVLHRLQHKARVVFLFQTMHTPKDFLRALLADLGVQETGGSFTELQAKLNEAVTEQSRLGKPLVVVIDEAQNLDDSVLELVRMLSNFETGQKKLIQIVLSGQPQLADKLASPELVQLRQRISIFARLKPFSPQQTALYIDHRLRTAGYTFAAPLFTAAALALIADCSQGIPRNINNLCFNALSLGRALMRKTIDSDVVREVIADLDLEPLRERELPLRLPEEEGAPGVSPFTCVASAPSIFGGWLPKLALACTILLVLGAALVQSHRWAAPKVTVRANSVVPPLAPAHTRSVGTEKRSPLATPAALVRVTPGQSLSHICAENFGSCNPRRLREIRALNPWLSDLDHIEPGQKIRVPAVQELSGTAPEVAEKSDNTSPAKRGTP